MKTTRYKDWSENENQPLSNKTQRPSEGLGNIWSKPLWKKLQEGSSMAKYKEMTVGSRLLHFWSQGVNFLCYCCGYVFCKSRKLLFGCNWRVPDLAEPLFIPGGRRWAADRSPSVLLRTARSHWSAGSAWSPEDETQTDDYKRNGESKESKQEKKRKISISVP